MTEKSSTKFLVEQIALGAHMLRQREQGTGTSILVAGFDEPREDEARPLRQIAADISRSMSRWFWPSLKEPHPKLAVFIEVYDNGSEIYNQKVEVNSEELPFVEALSAKLRESIILLSKT